MPARRPVLLLLLTLLGTVIPTGQAEPPPSGDAPVTVLSASPDGKFELCRRQADPGEHGEARKTLALRLAGGRVLYEWASPLGATSVLWSPDSRHAAVNDMPGDAGDLLRLFALDAGKPAVIPIREPDGKALLAEIEKRHGSFLSRVDRVNLRASDWKEGRLWCQVNGTFSPKRQTSLHVPFHHLRVYRIKDSEPPSLEQEWTLTDPKEKPFRDPSPNP